MQSGVGSRSDRVGRAPLTLALLSLLLLLTVAQRFDDDAIARQGSLLPSLVLRRPLQGFRLVTQAFVPNGHLADPLFAGAAIWSFGPALEGLFGARRLLGFVVLAALASGAIALLYGYFHPTFRAQPAHGVGTLGIALTVAFGACFPEARLAGVGAPLFTKVVVGLALVSVLLASQQTSPAAPVGALLFSAALARALDPRRTMLEAK